MWCVIAMNTEKAVGSPSPGPSHDANNSNLSIIQL